MQTNMLSGLNHTNGISFINLNNYGNVTFRLFIIKKFITKNDHPIAGHNIPAQTITRRVSTTDVAPTIAAYLGIKAPSGSVGDPLEEVLDRNR